MLAEAVDAGADAVLLIAGAVEPARLAELWAAARDLGLDVLLEVVQPFELAAPDALGSTLVGVNARDLETLEVEDRRFAASRARCSAAPGRLLVAESGIRTAEDVRRLRRGGRRRGAGGRERHARRGPGGRGARAGGGAAVRTRVKVCGITRLEDALACVEAGVDALGFNFWPGSKRHVTLARAADDRPVSPSRRAAGGRVRPAHRPRRSPPPSRAVGLGAVQLHGDEDPADVRGRGRTALAGPAHRRPRCRESVSPQRRGACCSTRRWTGFGGAGRTLRLVAGAGGAGRFGLPVWLAGGLTPDERGRGGPACAAAGRGRGLGRGVGARG